MEKSWIRENGDENLNELDLRIGAYLLAIGKDLDEAQERLTNASREKLASELLAELRKVREVLP